MDALIRNRKLKGGGSPRSANTDFIGKALNKIVVQRYISGEIGENDLEAVLIFNDKEGPDLGKFYTYEKDGLGVGDTIIKQGAGEDRDSYFLLVEEVKRVDGSHSIRVFNVLETNALINNEKPAYVKSNLRNKIYDAGREGIIVEAKEAVLVAPRSYGLKLSEVLNLSSLSTREESAAGWRVHGIDDISSPSVVYARLEQTLKSSEVTNTYDDKEEWLKPKTIKVLPTEDGYYKTELDIVKKRTASSITVVVPNVESFEIELKQNGEIITKKFKVRR